MSVQTLDAHACSTHSPLGLDALNLDGDGGSALGVLSMGGRELGGVHHLFKSMDPTFTFETAHRIVQFGVYQPIQSGHWRSVS
jgi:hypothetical protein